MKKIKPEKYDTENVGLEPAREVYPHFGIDLKHLPEAEKWRIGNTYYVTLELRQSDISMHKNKKGDDGRVGFDITGIEVLKNKKKDYRELPE